MSEAMRWISQQWNGKDVTCKECGGLFYDVDYGVPLNDGWVHGSCSENKQLWVVGDTETLRDMIDRAASAAMCADEASDKGNWVEAQTSAQVALALAKVVEVQLRVWSA